MDGQGSSSVVEPPSGQEDAVPDAAPEIDSPAETVLPSVVRRGRSAAWRQRAAAIACLLGCVIAVLAILAEGRSGDVVAAAPGIKDAARPAWGATSELSDALHALKPGSSRGPSIRAARKAAEAVKGARGELAKVDVDTSQGEVMAVVESALRAQGAWIDAVGSTLANPRSPRRKALAELASAAAARSRAAEHFDVADGPAVRGTGHLLSTTKS